MTCAEFEDLLDRLEPGHALGAEARRHAGTCPRCAFALRLESTLVAAPSWMPRERMAAERRAFLLARARTRFWAAPDWSARLQESALSALVAVVLLGAGVFALPPLLKEVLPPSLYEAAAAAVSPLVGEVAPLFAPLAATGAGLALLVFCGYALCFAASLGASVYAEAGQG